MTDTDDLTVINENFDTIKTLLNSIRAQGILNTSDVDKLLNGINSKLEKINTDEDIDIIKVFLSELKQNLDERHGVIVSKFGAIESLFSNLLKNSNELPKSDDLKKLFDVVATNISVFSREIVSQKESLTDIMLRIDAMRSDDTVKKDIIKNIALLKPDLERVSNGFDTIVLSLNDNFKTVVKTITSLDNPELIEKLSVGLNEMKMSTNTLLSAIDVIDKKADSIDVLIKDLVTKSDLMDTEKAIGEIKVLNQDISSNIVDISDRYNKIDNLAEKIDASVSIIAELKSTLENNEKEDTEKLLTNIEELSNKVENIKTDIQFEEFIGLLTSTLKEFEVKNVRMSDELKSLAEGLLQLSQLYKTIDINTSTQNITDAITSTEATIKNFVSEGIEKITEYDNSKILQLMDSFSSMADELQAKFNKSQSEISVFCDNRFGNIFDNVSELKVMVSQIDDNSISANNAIFSNISDRLDIFENTLRDALSTQETNANDASVKLFEQIDNIKNLSGVLDYKVDSSVLEISNLQNEFLNLKTAVNDVLALNFVETVKDLRADLYASKQDISTILEDSSSAVTEKLSNDLFSKYELVISKLDAIDDSFVKTQRAVLEDVKDLLGKMSSSVVDILSYVSETKSNDNGELETKIEGIEHALKENNLEYIENVKAIVDTIRDQVVSVLEVNGEKSNSQLNSLVSLVDKNSANIQEDIKNSYEKLNDILASYQELSKQIDISQSANNSNYGSLMTLANNINSDFEKKLSAVKNSLLEKIDTYKQEFSCENADKINEFKLSMDNISNKNSQCVFEILDEIKSLFKNLSAESAKERENAFNSVATDFLNLKDLLSTQANNNIESRNAISKNLTEQLDKIQTNIQTLETNIGNGRENALEKIAGLVGRLEVYINDINNKNIAQKEADNEIVLGAINELKSFIDNTNFQNSQDSDLGLNTVLDSIEGIKSVLEEVVNISSQSNFETLAEITEELRNLIASTEDNTADAISVKLEKFAEELRTFITSTEDNTVDAISAKLERNTEELRTFITSTEDNTADAISAKLERITEELRTFITSTEDNTVDAISAKLERITEELRTLITSTEDNTADAISAKLERITEELRTFITSTEDNTADAISVKLEKIAEELRTLITSTEDNTAEAISVKLENIIAELDVEKELLNKIDENIDGDLTRQLSIIESNFETLISQITILNDKSTLTISDKINETYENVSSNIQNEMSNKLDEYKVKIEETFDVLGQRLSVQSDYLKEKITVINSEIKNACAEQTTENCKQLAEITETLRLMIEEKLNISMADFSDFKSRIAEFTDYMDASNQSLISNLKAQISDITKYLDTVMDIQTQELSDRYDELTSVLNKNSESVSKETSEIKELVLSQSEIANNANEILTAMQNSLATNGVQISDLTSVISEDGLKLNKLSETVDLANAKLSEISELGASNKETIINTFIDKLKEHSECVTQLSLTELQSIENSAEQLAEQIEINKQSISTAKDFLKDFAKAEISKLAKEVEKETDAIMAELSDQFNSLKQSQTDETIKITSGIEAVIADHVYNNIEDLKSYLDVKTDNTIMSDKLDNLKSDVTSSLSTLITNLNKMLEADVFTSALSDYKLANELLINTAADNIKSRFDAFVKDNEKFISEVIKEGDSNILQKLALFDKKFVDTVVEKYEEIKLMTNQYNTAFDKIEGDIGEVITNIEDAQVFIQAEVQKLADIINKNSESSNAEIAKLNDCFDSLRAQISSKSFDEAFQASINKQVASLENLIAEQLGYIQDISELCTLNLPDVTEMSVLVKNSVLTSLDNLTERLGSKNSEGIIEKEIKNTKSEIITQILNLFNQISFVAEQEEILDFIQEKHDELITVLSHIVTTTETIHEVNDKLGTVDNQITTIKNEIGSINEKINNIISSDGDIDYIYSLQDLEADIANLRLALQNASQENNYKQEFSDLITSTENIYNLVEAIKAEIPDKQSFEGIAEDLVSISSRTNKLLLASDESYKTLQDNLQDFKLVIDDLDERTRNFARESGMDKINSKLNALNVMMSNDAKTNQVFNQVFEYLAEWVDNAGAQINSISNKIETLDDIGQIKAMLSDLKAEAEDNSDNIELIESLGNIFEKQGKKISAIETKLDKIIVETTILSNNKVDFSPMEETLNSFLVAMNDKIALQENKINSLEDKLVSLLAEKDTAQLTKKVGGMDKQIAKLNKSIEKIASHVVEK